MQRGLWVLGLWVLGRVLLVVSGLVVTSLAGSAAAQTEEAWHFETDTTRHARVDDRGGLGEGYSFSVAYDATDGNSEDFCPHCRLTLLVSDPGLDLAALERVGVSRSTLSPLIPFAGISIFGYSTLIYSLYPAQSIL